MARQQGAIRFTGRLANTVGFKARDGRGDGFDAMRAHVTQVANPQTLAQMTQRMKLTPVQNFYRGLQELLNHSWQGVRYKNPSRLHFYAMAMRALSTYGCPYVNKGDRQFVPWAFPISSGSVAVDTTVTSISSGAATLALNANSSTFGGTWGETSENIIAQNPGLKDGDQLTMVVVFKQGNNYIPYFCRVVLDVASTGSGQEGNDVALTASGGHLTFAHIGGGLGSDWVAAGLIVSRFQNGVWQRSDSVLAITASLRSAFNSTTAFSNMLASYKATSNNDSDWYLNDGSTTEQPAAAPSIKTGQLTIDGVRQSFAYYSDMSIKAVPHELVTDSTTHTQSDYLFNRVDATSIARQSSSAALELDASVFTADGYTLMTLAEFQAAYPDITVQAPDPPRP